VRVLVIKSDNIVVDMDLVGSCTEALFNTHPPLAEDDEEELPPLGALLVVVNVPSAE
jgi:hypothetical protein